jgi:hypothetical protein
VLGQRSEDLVARRNTVAYDGNGTLNASNKEHGFKSAMLEFGIYDNDRSRSDNQIAFAPGQLKKL